MKSEELLKLGLEELGFTFTKNQTDALLILVAELKKWNKAYNLTSIRTDRGIIIKHILDSLLYLNALPEGALNIADLGSGAGFPGIPIKIMRPDLEVSLVEPSRKKASFLRNIIRLLGLTGANVLQMRAEDISEDIKKTFDVVVSRATFSITDFIKAACPYLRSDCMLLISKGPNFLDEFRSEDSVKELIKEVRRAELPYEGGSRNLIIIECSQKTA